MNGSSDERVLYLHNPAHDPAGFLWLLEPPSAASSTSRYAPLRSTLPPVFDGVELSPTEPAPPAARRPRCRWQSHRIPRQRRTDRVRHLPRHLTPDGTGRPCRTIASPLQARCKANARGLQGPRGAVAPTVRAPGFTAASNPLKGSGNNPVSMRLSGHPRPASAASAGILAKSPSQGRFGVA